MDKGFIKQEAHRVDTGETVRVNHIDCPAGVDTRRRLYLTRPADKPGIVLAYCHNCQEGTRIVDSKNYQYKHRTKQDQEIDHAKQYSVVPGNYIDVDSIDLNDFPIQVHVREYLQLGLRYDASTGRINTPIMDDTHNIIGWNARAWKGRPHPKYVLNVPRDWDRVELFTANVYSNTLVLVEDQISAHACALAGYIGMCLFGAIIDPMTLHKYIKGLAPAKLVVWLDNDSAHIKRQASQIAHDAKLISKHLLVSMVLRCEDPKKFSLTTIEETVNGA